jgi:hypothetical protein
MKYEPILAVAADRHGHYTPFANPQPWPLHADTANFADYGDRIVLAANGVFSTDTQRHKVKRAVERGTELTLNAAYQYIGLNRDHEHKRLCAELEAGRTDGVWARSTGEYTKKRAHLDADVLATARKWGYSA